MTAGTLSGLGCALKVAVRCLICSTFCGSGFFTAVVGLVCAVAGVALAVVAAAGVALAVVAAAGVALAVAAAAGVALAVVVAAGVVVAFAAGVVVAVDIAGVAVAFVDAGAAVAVVLAAGEALGDVSALAAGDFIVSLLRRGDCSFFASGVALVADSRVFFSEVAGAVGFGTSGAFFSGFVTAGASDFGPGFTSAGCFLSGRCFLLLGDCSSSGAGVWAITAPASTREQTISKLVNFFMLILFWS